MRRSAVVIIGVIIAVCIICGVVLYMHNISKARSSSATSRSSTPNLENIVFSGLKIMNSTHYTEIVRGISKTMIYVSRVNGGQKMSIIITMFLNDVKSGVLKNSSVIVYYGYAKNVTTRMKMIYNGETHKALVQLINAKYLEVINMKNSSAKYCIHGMVIIKSDNYYNKTMLNNCITIPGPVVGILQYTRSLNMILARAFLPLLFKNVKYLGERVVDGQKCYMYVVNSTIDIAKLLSNETLLNELARSLSNLSNGSQKISVEKAIMFIRKIAMMLALTGLAEWSVQSKFCITPAGYTPYLYAKVTNTAKTMYNITIVVMSRVVEKVETGIVNTALLKSVEGSVSREVTYPSPELVYATYIPQASMNPLFMGIAAAETGYFITALHSVSAVSVSNVSKTTKIISPKYYKISISSNSLKVELKNGLAAPISYVTIILVNENTKKINRIEISCSPPLAQNSTLVLTCARGSSCKIYVKGIGKCTVAGRFIGASAGTNYTVFIFVKLSNNVKAISPPLKIEVKR